MGWSVCGLLQFDVAAQNSRRRAPERGCRGFQPDSINAASSLAAHWGRKRVAVRMTPIEFPLDDVGVPAYKDAVLDPQVAKSFVSL